MEAGKVATKKRESFMSEDEETSYKRKKRDEELLREERNTLETDKINSEMKTFDLDDHEDFTRLFHMVEVDALNPDMRLLWEEQENALLAKSPKGYRFHPK